MEVQSRNLSPLGIFFHLNGKPVYIDPIQAYRERKEDRGDVGLMTTKSWQRRLLWNTQLAQDRHMWRELVSSSVVADLQTWSWPRQRQSEARRDKARNKTVAYVATDVSKNAEIFFVYRCWVVVWNWRSRNLWSRRWRGGRCRRTARWRPWETSVRVERRPVPCSQTSLRPQRPSPPTADVWTPPLPRPPWRSLPVTRRCPTSSSVEMMLRLLLLRHTTAQRQQPHEPSS